MAETWWSICRADSDARNDEDLLNVMKDECENQLRGKVKTGFKVIKKQFHDIIYDDMEEKSILKLEVRIEAR